MKYGDDEDDSVLVDNPQIHIWKGNASKELENVLYASYELMVGSVRMILHDLVVLYVIHVLLVLMMTKKLKHNYIIKKK